VGVCHKGKIPSRKKFKKDRPKLGWVTRGEFVVVGGLGKVGTSMKGGGKNKLEGGLKKHWTVAEKHVEGVCSNAFGGEKLVKKQEKRR